MESRCEYKTGIELSGYSARYIRIPKEIIENTELDKRRLSIYSYFVVNKDLRDKTFASVSQIVQWHGLKPNTRVGKVNDKFLSVIEELRNLKFISYQEKLTKTSFVTFNFNALKKNDKYAVIYLDELYSIMFYRAKKNNKKCHVSTSVLLLVLAYLRYSIYNRPNCFSKSELDSDWCVGTDGDIENRRKIYPEAYDSTYMNIANHIGVDYKAVQRAVYVLENELKIITTATPYRIKTDNKYITPTTIFTNAYKREGNMLFAFGESYSQREIKNKERQLKMFLEKYIINHDKAVSCNTQ